MLSVVHFSLMPIAIPETPPCVMCLSAGDATAGGGLAADILTLASMGCHPLPVQTAALVRDTRGIDEVAASADGGPQVGLGTGQIRAAGSQRGQRLGDHAVNQATPPAVDRSDPRPGRDGQHDAVGPLSGEGQAGPIGDQGVHTGHVGHWRLHVGNPAGVGGAGEHDGGPDALLQVGPVGRHALGIVAHVDREIVEGERPLTGPGHPVGHQPGGVLQHS